MYQLNSGLNVLIATNWQKIYTWN